MENNHNLLSNYNSLYNIKYKNRNEDENYPIIKNQQSIFFSQSQINENDNTKHDVQCQVAINIDEILYENSIKLLSSELKKVSYIKVDICFLLTLCIMLLNELPFIVIFTSFIVLHPIIIISAIKTKKYGILNLV